MDTRGDGNAANPAPLGSARTGRPRRTSPNQSGTKSRSRYQSTRPGANNATSIALVGSVARGEGTPDSDCDFLAILATGASSFDLAASRLPAVAIA